MRARARRALGLIASIAAAAIVVGLASAQGRESDAERMAAANLAYERGEYAAAAQDYEALLALGYSDAALSYNLGNAYYKSGDLGRAILHYLRASHAAPRDADIRANLKLARAGTVDRIESDGGALFEGVASLAWRWASAGEAAALALALWTATAGAACVLILRRDRRRRRLVRGGAVVGGALTAAALALLLCMTWANPLDDAGVVVAASVEIVSGPGAQYATEFTLHAGAQVRLVDKRTGWLRVALPGGELDGWAPEDAIERALPGG